MNSDGLKTISQSSAAWPPFVTRNVKGTPSPGSAGCRSTTRHSAKTLAGTRNRKRQSHRMGGIF
jgi:hypothetical protein